MLHYVMQSDRTTVTLKINININVNFLKLFNFKL